MFMLIFSGIVFTDAEHDGGGVDCMLCAASSGAFDMTSYHDRKICIHVYFAGESRGEYDVAVYLPES